MCLATGVLLQDGEEIRAAVLVAAIDPTNLFTRLLEPSAISPELREEVDRMRVLSSGVSHFKADLAVTRRPSFPGHTVNDAQLAGLSFAASVDDVLLVRVLPDEGRRGRHTPAGGEAPAAERGSHLRRRLPRLHAARLRARRHVPAHRHVRLRRH
jgi:hypothetical protein